MLRARFLALANVIPWPCAAPEEPERFAVECQYKVAERNGVDIHSPFEDIGRHGAVVSHRRAQSPNRRGLGTSLQHEPPRPLSPSAAQLSPRSTAADNSRPNKRAHHLLFNLIWYTHRLSKIRSLYKTKIGLKPEELIPNL